MRLAYSLKPYVCAFPTARQESFFAGHVAAFQAFGGVPHRIDYDNLTTAVQKVLVGRNRTEQDAFIAFRGQVASMRWASGTVSIRTSPAPYMTVARKVVHLPRPGVISHSRILS